MSESLQRQSSSQRRVKLAAHDVKVHHINYQRRQHTPRGGKANPSKLGRSSPALTCVRLQRE